MTDQYEVDSVTSLHHFPLYLGLSLFHLLCWQDGKGGREGGREGRGRDGREGREGGEEDKNGERGRELKE